MEIGKSIGPAFIVNLIWVPVREKVNKEVDFETNILVNDTISVPVTDSSINSKFNGNRSINLR